jgi:hypothetical protein
MIVSASYRTDIPAFYAGWFRRRLWAGFARTTNPYGGQVHEVDLSPAGCDGFVFWTRNAAPFRDALAEVRGRGFPFVVQYTLTGYPRALEASVVAADRAVEAMHGLARTYGRETVVWRYDPVMLTSLTPPDWHLANFARLARMLKGACDEVVFSFAHIYDKTRRNTDRAAARHGFSWWDPADGEKIGLLEELAGIAAEAGFTPTLCAQPQLLREPLFTPLSPARCIDAGRLSRVAGREIAAPTKGNRPGCLCARARDIGAYDTCPHGCVYCYAVQRPDTAKRRHRQHDPASEFLVTPGSGAGRA